MLTLPTLREVTGKVKTTSFFAAYLVILASVPAGAELLDKPLPMHMPNFRLEDYTGKVHELHDYKDAKAIVIFVQGNGCPIVRQSFPYYEEIKAEFEPKGVTFLYVNSNDFDNAETIREEAEEFGVTIPVLIDKHQALAHALEFDRTAETLIVDPKTWDIVYRGMADDRFDYGLQRSAPKKFWLKQVLDEMTSGKAVDVPSTVAKGCLIDIVPVAEAPSYAKDIAPILDARLKGCAHGDSWSAMDEQSARERSALVWQALLTGEPAGAVCSAAFSKGEARKVIAWLEAAEDTGE